MPRQWYQPQEPRQPLKPILPPEQLWQHLEADFMSFDGSEYLVIIDYYSKMPIICKMPTSQCKAAKTITHLKELFIEHGLPESIRLDNGPSSLAICSRSLQKNGTSFITWVPLQTPTAMDRLSQQWRSSKVSSPDQSAWEDLYLALLSYRSTTIDSHLRSPGEILYQHVLHTTVHQDPHAVAKHERLEAAHSAANHYHTGCHKKAPLYAEQTVSVLNCDRTLWPL